MITKIYQCGVLTVNQVKTMEVGSIVINGGGIIAKVVKVKQKTKDFDYLDYIDFIIGFKGNFLYLKQITKNELETIEFTNFIYGEKNERL